MKMMLSVDMDSIQIHLELLISLFKEEGIEQEVSELRLLLPIINFWLFKKTKLTHLQTKSGLTKVCVVWLASFDCSLRLLRD